MDKLSRLALLPTPLFKSVLVMLMLLLLGLIMQVRHHQQIAEKQIVIREVSVARINPPPSPPESVSQTAQTTSTNLELVTTASEVSLKIDPLQVNLPELNGPVMQGSEVGAELGFELARQDVIAGIETFGLEQLDQPPRLLTRITARLPPELAQQGVEEMQLTLRVIIHENGSTEFKNLKSESLAQLVEVAEQIATQARFTPPLKDGKRVKAEFFWPVRIKA